MSDDATNALGEIGGEMVDQIIDGIGQYCARNPDPRLTPERHLAREIGNGLRAMQYNDLLTLCTAALTRIAHPDNAIWNR